MNPNKKSNANNGKKAHLDDRYIKVGRIKFSSWAVLPMKASDVIIFESKLIHIKNRHHQELDTVGMTAMDFVLFIVKNFNTVRQGSGNCLLLVVERPNISNVAAIELTEVTENGKECYKINTATLWNNEQLQKKKKLCTNVHRLQ